MGRWSAEPASAASAGAATGPTALGFRTVKPGSCRPRGAPQAPHIDVSVLARGLLDRVVTRVYFADEAEANAADPCWPPSPSAGVGTLVAQRTDGGYRFDVRLQGDGETVFFDL